MQKRRNLQMIHRIFIIMIKMLKVAFYFANKNVCQMRQDEFNNPMSKIKSLLTCVSYMIFIRQSYY